MQPAHLSGVVYWEEEYPNLLFAKDGEVFDLDGKQAIVMGGAYSIDKMVRLMYGYGWWPDEQLSDEVKRYVEGRLDRIEDRLDYGKWYCGHYHTEKKVGRVEIMFENFGVLYGGDRCEKIFEKE